MKMFARLAVFTATVILSSPSVSAFQRMPADLSGESALLRPLASANLSPAATASGDLLALQREILALEQHFKETLEPRLSGGLSHATTLIREQLQAQMAKRGNTLQADSLQCQRADGKISPAVAGTYVCEFSYTNEDNETSQASLKLALNIAGKFLGRVKLPR